MILDQEHFRSVSLVTYLLLRVSHALHVRKDILQMAIGNMSRSHISLKSNFLLLILIGFFGQEQQGTEISNLAKSRNDK